MPNCWGRMESNQLPKYGAHQNPQHRHLVIHAPKDYMVEKNRKLKEQFAAAAQAGSEGLDINSSSLILRAWTIVRLLGFRWIQ